MQANISRFEETDWASSTCIDPNECVGGYGRVVTIVKHLLKERNNTNPIYLNAGDNFQGTLWYNIGRWDVTQYFLNLLPADAMVKHKPTKVKFTLPNHF